MNQSIGGKLDDVIAYYGGDKLKAYQALQDPIESRKFGWKQSIDDINSTTEMVNKNYETMLDVKTRKEQHDITVSDELYKRANDVVNALNNFSPEKNNWAELGKKVQAFDALNSLDAHIKKFEVHQTLEKRFEQTANHKVERGPGGYILTTETKKDWDSAVKATAKEIAKFYQDHPELGINEDTITKYLTELYPTQVEEKNSYTKDHKPNNGNGDDKNKGPLGAWGYGAGKNVRGKYANPSGKPVDVFHVELAPRKEQAEFTYGGVKVQGNPVRLEYRDDGWYALFREANTEASASSQKGAYLDTAAGQEGVKKDAEGNVVAGSATKDEAKVQKEASTAVEMKEGVIRAVPLKDVAARLQLLYGTSDPYELGGPGLREAMEKRGATKVDVAAAEKKAKSGKATVPDAVWNKLTKEQQAQWIKKYGSR